jgi:uncharacterized DUF497 family protein
MHFEWDAEKAEENFRKHRIDFDDAIAIFDGTTLEDEDGRFNYGEVRVRAIGALGPILISVIYTMRGDVCRIISAREATKSERQAYRDAQSR